MRSLAERRSNPVRAALGAALAIACAIAPVHAQAPSCAWGDGVALPGGDNRPVLIADDGGAGVVAVTWPIYTGQFQFLSSLRFFHVLEQGRLDPNLPADGVPLISSSDLPARPEFTGLRVLADGDGGAYVLFRACNSTTERLTCWENSEFRLLHATAQGAIAPGWPPLGIVLNASLSVSGTDNVGIVPAGPPSGAPAGVIAAWIEGRVDSTYARTVRAQRFAADGIPQWPGGVGGLTVLASPTEIDFMAVGADHAGGCTVIASQRASDTNNRYELISGRVEDAGGLPWTTGGKLVVQQPTFSVLAQSVVVDDLAQSYVTALLTPVSAGTRQAYAQLLAPEGTRLWGMFGLGLGLSLGSSGDSPVRAFLNPTGFESVHGDATGMSLFQLQDASGTPQWDPSGVAATWAAPPAPQLPLVAPDGHTLSVWLSGDAPPNDGVRVMELDEGGAVLPGYPSNGAAICGAQPGHYASDAMILGAQLFVALGSGEATGVEPLVQRMSRAVLATDLDLPARPLDLSPPAPNPARNDWLVRLALHTQEHVTLEAFDIAGRRALTADLGTLEAGRHALAVPDGASLVPGVYRVRVRAGEHTAERVLVKVR
jgi:hypothetical protein